MAKGLFDDNRWRAVGGAIGVALLAHVIMLLVPNNLYGLNVTQTIVAIIALGGFAMLIVMHHRTQGQMLTQDQEEILLIGAFGLFWLAFLVAYRALRQRNGVYSVSISDPVSPMATAASAVKEAVRAAGHAAADTFQQRHQQYQYGNQYQHQQQHQQASRPRAQQRYGGDYRYYYYAEERYY